MGIRSFKWKWKTQFPWLFANIADLPKTQTGMCETELGNSKLNSVFAKKRACLRALDWGATKGATGTMGDSENSENGKNCEIVKIVKMMTY